MNEIRWIVTVLLAVGTASGWAQPEAGGVQPPPPMQGQDRQAPRTQRGQFGHQHGIGQRESLQIEKNLFSPELVMGHRKEIKLTDEQRGVIRTAIKESMTKFAEIQMDVSEQTDVLESLLEADRVDEAKVSAQLDKVLKLENEIKRLRLMAALKVKNALTPEQQKKLKEFKAARGADGRGGMCPPPMGMGSRNRAGACPGMPGQGRGPGNPPAAGGDAMQPPPPPENAPPPPPEE